MSPLVLPAWLPWLPTSRDTVPRGPPPDEGNYSARIEAGGFDHEEDDYQNNPPLYDNI